MDKTIIESYLNEEQNDEQKYLRMASELEKTHPKLAGIFRDIACDEHSHQKALDYIKNKL